MIIHFESGLAHRLVVEIDRSENSVEINLHFGCIGDFDSVFFPYASEKPNKVIEGIKKEFLRMVGAYLMNAKVLNEAILAEAALICGKMHEQEEKVATALEEINAQIKSETEA